MTKYQELIKKIHTWQQQDPYYSISNFSPSELELIAEALETIQFLEIIFKARKLKELMTVEATKKSKNHV